MVQRTAKLKIGLVLDDTLDSSDGVQQYVLTIGRWLTRQGHEVHYLVGETKRHDLPNLHSLTKNVRVNFNANKMSMPLPANKRAIRTLLAREQFDILHIQASYSPYMSGRIINITNKVSPHTKIIGTFHIAANNSLARFGSRILGWLNHRTSSKFDKFLAVSPAARDFSRHYFGCDSEVLPCPLDLSVYKGVARPRKAGQPLSIVFLGRLVPKKGCLVLLKAITALQGKDLPSYRVTVAGAGQEEQMLKQYVTEHNLDQLVDFVGFADLAMKQRLFGSADICVFPSGPAETFGIVLVEAMAAGNAVVLGSDNDGYQSVLGGRPELMFPLNDSGALAERLTEFMTDPSRRKAAVTWQDQHVKTFDINSIGRRLVNHYKQLLEK